MSDTPLSEQTLNDIADALHRLRRAFIRHGLNPPVSVELATYEDGERLRYSLPRNLIITQPTLTDAPDPRWCCNIVGVELLWPGKWRARERGGRDLV
jgi:hypothetical protein